MVAKVDDDRRLSVVDIATQTARGAEYRAGRYIPTARKRVNVELARRPFYNAGQRLFLYPDFRPIRLSGP